MNGDIAISWDAALSRGDWVLSADGDLETGGDLQTAILISIFTDAMAAPDDVIPDGTNDPRGWWGDEFDSQHPIGSKLWLLDRAKQTQKTLNRAFSYLSESLQWLIDDGVVGRFDIQVQWVRASFLGASITAYSPQGSVMNAGQYLWAWNGVN